MSRSYEQPYSGARRPDSGGRPTLRTHLERLGRWLDVRLNRFLRPGTLDWAAACHLAPLVVVALPLPGAGALIALAIWNAKRNVETGVAAHGREALNVQINAAFWSILALAVPGAPELPVRVAASGLALIGGLAALRGESFRYPFILRPVE